MQQSSFRILTTQNSTISLRMIRVEMLRLISFKEDVYGALDVLHTLAKIPNLILSKSKSVKLFRTQATLCKVLEDLVARLGRLQDQMLEARNLKKTKDTLFQFSQTFQQLKVEAELFREMHFRVKRNCMKRIHNFPQLIKKTKEPIKMAA